MGFDPNAPAFGEGSQKPEDLQSENAKPEFKPEGNSGEKETENSEESKVPYSRFKKFHDQAKQWEAEAERYRAEAEEWRTKASSSEPKIVNDNSPFSWEDWKEMYGENDLSKKLFQKQLKFSETVFEQARREALEAVRAENRFEQSRVSENLETIDSSLELLDEYAGRSLTEAEQSAILDIVDDYSPKGSDGNYLSTIPFEKAYDIYELQQQASKAPKVQSRNKIASLLNSKSQGTPSNDEAERNKNFDPRDWGAALRRLGQK